MTLRQILDSIRIARRPLSLAAFLGAGASGMILGQGGNSVCAEEPLVTNVGHFQIPFDIETEPGKRAEGFAVLFGSQDGGSQWDQLQSVPASQNSFMFAAPRDGRYSFAIRVTDPQGNVIPPPRNSVPELDVIVDTIAPELKLELFESTPGQVVIHWTCTDSSVVAETLAIEFSDGASGRWKPVQLRPASNGQALIPASQGAVVAVRASIADSAGNRAEASSQIVARGHVASTTPVQAAQPRMNTQPMGPSPFGAAPIAPVGNVAGVQQAMTSANNQAMTSVAIPQMNHGTAVVANHVGVQQMSPALPVQNLTANIAAQAQQRPEDQLVNMHIFDVDYQVEDVGPSGVSAVELFVTEDGGQQWFRYGTDVDLRSPYQVDAQGEGTFGFAVRVRNGLGFAEAPPQPGEKPEIVVTVDETAPIVELAQPTVRSDGFGTLDLSWRVTDLHPSAAPVRLEYSTTSNGPWIPVFDWQADQGGYQWAVRPGMPSSIYFRLLARDAAGNVGLAQTPNAVIVDLKKPVGRLLRVQAVSHSTPARQ